MIFLSGYAFGAFRSSSEVTNALCSSPGCHVYSGFFFFLPPLVPIRFAQQLFTGEAAGSQPAERFMQIERSGPFDESFPPARKFEVVDPHR